MVVTDHHSIYLRKFVNLACCTSISFNSNKLHWRTSLTKYWVCEQCDVVHLNKHGCMADPCRPDSVLWWLSKKIEVWFENGKCFVQHLGRIKELWYSHM